MLSKEIWRSRLAVVMGVLLTCVLGIKAQDNKLTIEDFAVVPGEEKSVEVILTNADPVSSLQFDMSLPAGLEYVTETLEKVNSRITNHTVKINKINGRIRVAIFSNAVDIASSAIKGNDGAILTFKVKASASFKSGDIRLVDIVGSNGTTAIPTAVEFESYTAKAVANAGTFALSCGTKLMVSDFEAVETSFRLHDAINVVGLQLDVVLPDGFSFAKNENGETVLALSERVSENARIGMNKLADGTYRILVSSLTNEVFEASTDTLFTFGLIADEAFEEGLKIEVKNVKVSDPAGNTFPLAGDGVVALTYSGPRGDVNHDQSIDIDDIYAIIEIAISGEYSKAHDLTNDGSVDIDDIYEGISLAIGE